ncbi:GntR family transcriptional regulator [Streptomyces sp. NPDC060194]|uniref:GntR family transcriptional regulator n=1 Tax=Streptomyces sp. NPDC060194 TaxID=3347069 RepID=UPI0036556B1D
MAGEEHRDSGSEVQRVQDVLRTRLADGTYSVGQRLKSQADLAKELGVSRDTVQKAMSDLVDEGWLRTRPGSGTTVTLVRATQSPRGADLRALLEAAFEEKEVRIDVWSLSSETFDLQIRNQALRVAARQVRPERIEVRMLLPGTDVPLSYPRRYDGGDDERLTARMHALVKRHSESVRDTLLDLQDRGLVREVDVQIRYVPVTPTSKVYLINGKHGLMGFYDIERRPIRVSGDDGDELVDALDVLGFGSTLLHFFREPAEASVGRKFVDAAQRWFESHWMHLGDPSDPSAPSAPSESGAPGDPPAPMV